MPQLRCPHCRTTLDVAPQQQGQVIACANCHSTLTVPSMDQIQAPDMRLDAPPPVVPPPLDAIAEPATGLPTAEVARTSWDEILARSRAFRREMNRFRDDTLPDLLGFDVLPLPGELPADADELGEPMVSIQRPAQGLVSLVVGLVILVLGVIGCVGLSVAALIHPPRDPGDALGPGFMMVVFAVAGGAVAWSQKRLPKRTLWVCPGGLIWQYGNHADFCHWEEVDDFAISMATGRPLIWLSPAAGVDFVLSGGLGPEISPAAEYIEVKTSAALLPIFLEAISRGERVAFGKLAMDRTGIYWRSDRCRWSEIDSVRLDGSYFVVNHVRHRGRFRLFSREVSFPMVAQAIARIITEEGLPSAP